MIAQASLTIVLAAAAYLVALGASALFRPALAEQFLGGHATTRTLHFLELELRGVAGAAFVSSGRVWRSAMQ